MIHIKKRDEIPQTLDSEKVKRTKRRLEEKVKNGDKPNNKDKDFPPHWLDDDVRLKIWEDQNEKCCYCERRRDAKREADIEHFRPRAEVAEEPEHLGYWWLAYDWSNLLFSCRACNQEYKKTQFPLRDGNSNRARQPGDKLSNEKPVLIHPCEEDPEAFLDYTWDDGSVPLAKPIGRDDEKRGCQTIRILKLDRDNLNEDRGSLIRALLGVAAQMHAAVYHGNADLKEQARRRIREETEAKEHNRFVGFRREYFRKAGLGEYVASD